MSETYSVRPIGGLNDGPREDYRPGPAPFRRDTGRIAATVRPDVSKVKNNAATGAVKLEQPKTHVEMVIDAVRDGHRSLGAIQSVTCFNRKKVRDITNKQINAGNLMVDETALGEKIFSLPGDPMPDSAVKGSQDHDDVSADSEHEPMVDNPGDVVDAEIDAEMFSENMDTGSGEEAKGIHMEEHKSDLGYMHERLEHLYRTAQSSLGAFWEAVVELREMADDALLAKEKLLKVYDVIGQGCGAQGNSDKAGHADVQGQ